MHLAKGRTIFPTKVTTFFYFVFQIILAENWDFEVDFSRKRVPRPDLIQFLNKGS